MSSPSIPSEQRVLLDSISWQKFEALLRELGEARTTRLAYNRGQLEMMTPNEEHERCRKLIESLLLVLADETYLKVSGFSSTLLQQFDPPCAVEPDACFYIQDAELMSRQTTIDLASDPVPELVFEVALTPSSLDKLPIYAAIAIPEVWRYVTEKKPQTLERKLLIYQLQAGQYQLSEFSSIFPFLSAARVEEFIEQSDSLGLVQALQLLRAWVGDRV
jgi:Uma2 family endonuclease